MTIHEFLTLASIVELEGLYSSDRAIIAGVFYNRLESRWSLGSDVTTYYGSKIDDFSYSLTNKELKDCTNAYNTRCATFKKLPIGPICNPSIESIDASLNPTNSDNLYFLADKNGKIYFNKNSSGHINTKNKLIKENLWY